MEVVMSKIYWRKNDGNTDLDTGGEWTDLIDPTSSHTHWRITYRKIGQGWQVMYSGHTYLAKRDKLIPEGQFTEAELRNQLMLEYLLTRWER
jgi:hypothetical protein